MGQDLVHPYMQSTTLFCDKTDSATLRDKMEIKYIKIGSAYSIVEVKVESPLEISSVA